PKGAVSRARRTIHRLVAHRHHARREELHFSSNAAPHAPLARFRLWALLGAARSPFASAGPPSHLWLIVPAARDIPTVGRARRRVAPAIVADPQHGGPRPRVGRRTEARPHANLGTESAREARRRPELDLRHAAVGAGGIAVRDPRRADRPAGATRRDEREDDEPAVVAEDEAHVFRRRIERPTGGAEHVVQLNGARAVLAARRCRAAARVPGARGRDGRARERPRAVAERLAGVCGNERAR